MFRHCLFALTAALSGALLVACTGSSAKSPPLPSTNSAESRFAAGAPSLRDSATLVPDRIVLIVMENHNFDEIIGSTDLSGHHLLAPFFTLIAQTNGLATQAFGVSQPTLPNYLSLLSGDSFGIHDDNSSCYAVPPSTRVTD